MKYMLLTYIDEKAWLSLSDAERQQAMDECAPHTRELLANGKLLAGAPLHPSSTATCVRVHSGKRIITDGPFAETREQLGGYSLLEAKDLDEAIEIAAGYFGRSKVNDFVTIEVRPIMDFALPAEA
jgi:hypothetical protein